MGYTDFFLKVEIKRTLKNGDDVTIGLTPHYVIEKNETHEEAKQKVYNDSITFIETKFKSLEDGVQSTITTVVNKVSPDKEKPLKNDSKEVDDILREGLKMNLNNTSDFIDDVLSKYDVEIIKVDENKKEASKSNEAKKSRYAKYL